MTLALLCSGQGHQGPGMLDLFAEAPILATAGALLGHDVRAFLDTAGEEALHANRASQILCVARGLAAAACLAPKGPLLIAGYSVGEMTAWGVAGVWPPERTLRLAARRAELMDAASGADDGLGYVRGLPREQVARLAARFDCAIAIVNPGDLFVIGGPREEVARCCRAALEAGAAAARAIAVRVASHTPRLSGAVAPFRAALEASQPGRPARDRTLIGAADGAVVAGAAGLAGLAAQLAATIDWAAVLEAMVERGMTRVLELGPGTALADMVRSAYPALDVRAIDDFRSLDGIQAWLAR
ncbi:acyltransferase domain-containing protein [Labrys monachus]|uniref:[acyl-carrier-protein] S-malonyltransferase n=1 Tax=Labrys monachus TaxID=217067 RepID=A0ABU0FP86_9HYPH|nr:acyltransferase domain-containing protein [Labrys monachus]MDQ0396425.1 [acyl-carrier-protein] S-malonyltransferase [Labrys monachus]